MGSGCLDGNTALSVRVILYMDIAVYMIYAVGQCSCTHRFSWLLHAIVSFALRFNLFMIFFISYLYYTDTEISWTAQLGGLVAAAIFSILGFIQTMIKLAEDLVLCVMIIAGQLTNTYLPTLLNNKWDIPFTTSESFVLLIPFLAILLLRCALGSRVVACVLTCIILSFFVVLSLSITHFHTLEGTFTMDSIYDPICCDLQGECPIFLPPWLMYFMLLLIFILLVLCLCDGCRRGYQCLCGCCIRRNEKQLQNKPKIEPERGDEKDTDVELEDDKVCIKVHKDKAKPDLNRKFTVKGSKIHYSNSPMVRKQEVNEESYDEKENNTRDSEEEEEEEEEQARKPLLIQDANHKMKISKCRLNY